ncbi:Serine/threonine-protein kinase SMG1 [Camellia lanceoleosa]|uniref:Serine/threonine-protein kinase SMG1 n=1 Tax=Camellia lanceoleosa TaxID=1840588 RepID=A0ACC0HUB4_9ERIC|nr:Serine/threonine-protein kinase SMG1 [Camellia lanceoleosa]
MQGLHHQQQQLVALLTVARGGGDSTSSSSTTASASAEGDESSRLAAINSLHRAILYPPNSLLVTHSASFLSQGFSQLLSDKSYSVCQAAATAYGALCSVLCSILISSNGRQNNVILGSLVDRFISWALPLLTNVGTGDGKTELALEAFREFLNVGDVGAIERYALPILKACQELLEDERTSLSLLHQLLGVLTLISLKFFRCFQPHFVDIVDLLLGWAMVPDLAESDRRIIMDSFLQFQKHWVNSLQFSLGLLSKFLGDMDVLLQDGSLGTPQQFQRLLALLSCFCTVLQSTASGLLEMHLLEQIIEPLSKMIPLLLGCLSMVGRKFGWSKWIVDSWRCLTLLAEILSERFSTFYPLAVDVLFQSLAMDNLNQNAGAGRITSFQVHGVLKTNLQLLSLQKLGLLPSSVHKILQFDLPVSQLRLHPNHLVTGSSAATDIFLLQHGKNEVVEQAVTSLVEELELLKGMLEQTSCNRDKVNSAIGLKIYSKPELFVLIKFDLKVLLSCASVGGGNSLIARAELDALCLRRSERLASFIVEKLNPFDLPIQAFVELQANVVKTLDQLTMFEFLNKWSTRKQISRKGSLNTASEKLPKDDNMNDGFPFLIFEHLQKYSFLLVKALHISSPLAVKVEALQWIYKFCEGVIDIYESMNAANDPCDEFGFVGVVGNLVFSVLDAASDRDPKVRSHVASVLEQLLQAKLINPTHFYAISEVVLEKLGDPDGDIKNAFVRMLSHVLPITIYTCGLYDCGTANTYRPSILRLGNSCNLHWRQVFALKQLPQQLHSQQLVSILSFVSQRWKVPLSSWIQRLIHTCWSSKGLSLTQLEETGNNIVNDVGLDIKVEEDILERICSVNILAGAWWAIHEAARYCITTRLRTNLGGPTQTFAALERMLLDIAHVLQLDTEQSDGNLNIIGSSYAHLLPMRLLLDFVEALKKNVYNAYEGSAVLPCTSRQSSLFFRANRKVCEEWFSRICEPMMNAGLALQCHHATIHYCTLRLQELRNLVVSALNDKPRAQVADNLHNIKGRFSEDILRVLRHMALALCKSHESEALIGLQKWVTLTFSSLLTDENHSLSNGENLGPFSWITGLVYQAEGQYEKSAAHFTHLLQLEESLSSMGSDGVQFAIARIIESYAAVSDWKSLESWLLELQTLRAKHAGKSYSGALTTTGNEINAIHALARFDEGDFQAAWSCLDLTPKSCSELTLDPKLALQRSEQMLLQAMLLQIEGKVEKVSHEIQKSKSMLEEALSVLPLDGLVEAAAYATQLHCISAFEESCKLTGNQDKQLQSLLSSYTQVLHSPINPVHQDCNMWLKVHRLYRTILPTSLVTLKLSKNLLSLARKQKNLVLANRLNNYVRDHALSCSEGRYRDFLMTNLQYEGILLMHAENRLEDAFTNLWSFLRPCVVSSSVVSDADVNVLTAKACLKLSDWLRRDYSDMHLEKVVLKVLTDFSITDIPSLGKGAIGFSDDNLSSKPNVGVIVEELVGTATKLSSRLCPSLGKSWISYGSWCYNQAKASLSVPNETVLYSCSFSSILASEVLPDRFKLTEEELLKVKHTVLQLLQKRSNSEDLNEEGEEDNFQLDSSENLSNDNYAKVLVQQAVNIIESAAGVLGAESSSGDCLSAMLTSQLQKCFLCANVGIEESAVLSSVDDLVDVWWSLRRRRVSLFGHAAQAFVHYLSYSSSKHSDGQLAASFCEALNQKTVSYTLRATLYVLNILLNYGVELKETLEPALSTGPLLPWQEITPQLFARLSSHPEQVVRKLLEGLLVMLAKLSPWSIVYPTLVDVNACEQEPSEELQHIQACLLAVGGGGTVLAMVCGVEASAFVKRGEVDIDKEHLHSYIFMSAHVIPVSVACRLEKEVGMGEDGLMWCCKGAKGVFLVSSFYHAQESVQEVLCSWRGDWVGKRRGKAWDLVHLCLMWYCGSVAAMSMVGHILGLGDRHLDNILMDFSDGDILHIDYNVCFDKGQRLKIPEIVPFRLTQTIEAALGLTGIEGAFRANCEAVLGVLRKNKDIVLMLLEVFVWDPLVEWARGDFHDDAAIIGEERKGMELAVSLSLFASRVQEIRVPLQEHHDLLLGTLPAVESAFERFTSILNQYELVSALFYRADQERSNLVLRETSAKSNVAEATCNSEKACASFEVQAREFTQAKAVVVEKAQEATTWMEQHGRILDALRSSSISEIKAYLQLTGTEEALSLTSAILVAGVPLTIVPEPTQAQCRDIDREVSQLIAELDHGLSSAVTAVQEYSLALQRILPLNYLTTSPMHGWAQVLELSVNSISSDILSLSRRQATELIAKVQGDGFDSGSSYDDLCLKVEKYAEEIQKTELRAKDRLLSAFMKYMQSAGLARKEDTISAIHAGPLKLDGTKDARFQGELEDKKEKVLTVLNIAVSSLYSEVKRRVLNILNHSTGGSPLGIIFCDLEEQVEKCALVAGFVSELQQFICGDLPHIGTDDDCSNYFFQRNWASNFKTSLLSCKNLVGQMIEVVLPDVIRSVVSFNSEVMDAFGSLSQIRGSIDTALEQLVEVELERASLVELEQNYFVKVGLITEQQLALEEASVKGRDHLSWEEAEELASQEEACRAQLDKLHQAWNQKDIRTTSLMKREASIRNALFSSESHFQSIISSEKDSEPHIARSKALLAALVQPFSELESIDKALASLSGLGTSCSSGISRLADLMSTGCSLSEYIWKFPNLMNNHTFFIWKVGVVDSFLDSCIHDTASCVDQNLGLDQLFHVVKKKLEIQFHEHIGQYLKERVGPILLAGLDKENELLKQPMETTKELAFDQVKKDFGAVRRVQLMLEEYSRSAASLMKRQVTELKEALHKTSLEIVQMQWIHDISLNPLHNVRLISHKYLASEDKLFPVILNLSRPKLLESIQSSVSKIARSLECLQACERTSVTAEGQLERAMGWACGARDSGIPPEFHNHLMRRQQLLWDAREKASDIIKICVSILEFEASRDGIFRTSGDIYPFRTGADGRTWQQAYLNALTRLDVTYHSFTRAEQEWNLAQSDMEAASNGLFSATNELCIASVKAKSASGDLQSTLVAMKDCAYEASVALSAFGRVTRGHTALTSECGSMLEEVLAITEDLHDVHSLGKEAAAVHSSLMEDLSKANTILLPLESVLSKDVAAMTDSMARERETKMEISPIHGQAIYQSYYLRIKEAYQAFKPLVPSLSISVKGLHSMLTRLARTASLHAGNLHKALEGLGESEEARSQDINLSRPEVAGHDSDYNSKEGEVFSKSDRENKGWTSPPESICSSSSENSETSAEESLADSFSDLEVELSGTDSQETLHHAESESRYKEANDGGTDSVDECLRLGESPYDESVSSIVQTSNSFNQENPQMKLGLKDESSLNQDKIEDEDRETPFPTIDVGNRVTRGKNAYAMSVLKRVEMKLDGQDIADNRPISIAEQVDYLLKQATSVDNLCNMYEGWTPWI